MYFPFDQDWNNLERGHYLSWTRINAGGPKCGYYSTNPRTIIEVRLIGPWPDIAPTRRPLVGHLNRSIFHLTKIGLAWGGAIILNGLE